MTVCNLVWRTPIDDGHSLVIPVDVHRCIVEEEPSPMLRHEHHGCGCGATHWAPGLQGAARAALQADPTPSHHHRVEVPAGQTPLEALREYAESARRASEAAVALARRIGADLEDDDDRPE